ncbi:MAG: hypothetical protein O8C61_06475 [Candidatus Methanoperedens sp.]|nr:hypothetical protein [Candidatus Methanoperedens sp.]
MDGVVRKKLFFTALAFLAVLALIVVAWFVPLQKSKYVHIVSEVGISQGAAENNTEMEIIKVHGTFWNDGSLVARNVTATVIFTDAAQNKIFRKTVMVGIDVLPDKHSIFDFDTEFLREKTLPKTEVNATVQFDWIENGQFKNSST